MQDLTTRFALIDREIADIRQALRQLRAITTGPRMPHSASAPGEITRMLYSDSFLFHPDGAWRLTSSG